MTDEKIKFANMLKDRINKLDKEIHLIMDLMPATRSAGKFVNGMRGRFQKVRGRNLIWERPPLKEREIELSNEDCRALMDIRTAEMEALQQVLSELD